MRRRPFATGGERIRRIGLDLNGISAGRFGGLHDPDCLIKAMIMVSRHFGDNVCRITFPNPAFVNVNIMFCHSSGIERTISLEHGAILVIFPTLFHFGKPSLEECAR